MFAAFDLGVNTRIALGCTSSVGWTQRPALVPWCSCRQVNGEVVVCSLAMAIYHPDAHHRCRARASLCQLHPPKPGAQAMVIGKQCQAGGAENQWGFMLAPAAALQFHHQVKGGIRLATRRRKQRTLDKRYGLGCVDVAIFWHLDLPSLACTQGVGQRLHRHHRSVAQTPQVICPNNKIGCEQYLTSSQPCRRWQVQKSGRSSQSFVAAVRQSQSTRKSLCWRRTAQRCTTAQHEKRRRHFLLPPEPPARRKQTGPGKFPVRAFGGWQTKHRPACDAGPAALPAAATLPCQTLAYSASAVAVHRGSTPEIKQRRLLAQVRNGVVSAVAPVAVPANFAAENGCLEVDLLLGSAALAVPDVGR
eukprot:m.276385 g.276385  ORF g.276385 m.276385 type:complete len:361 (-) comp19365_c0_seq4:1039-2121(-)